MNFVIEISQNWNELSFNQINLDNSSMISEKGKQNHDLMVFYDKSDNLLPTFALEPNIVQRINFDWTTGVCKNGFNDCIQEAHLAWLNQDTCQFNLVCPTLQAQPFKLDLNKKSLSKHKTSKVFQGLGKLYDKILQLRFHLIF